jgi:hypothetical protein
MSKLMSARTKQQPPQMNARISVQPSLAGSNAEKHRRPENARKKERPVAVVKHPTYFSMCPTTFVEQN